MAGSIPETVGNCPKQWGGAKEKLKGIRLILVNEVSQGMHVDIDNLNTAVFNAATIQGRLK